MAERIPIAFLAGVVSVITPCVLPLVPGYLSAVSAMEANQLGQRGAARRIVVASIPFMIGFTIVFVALGAGAATIGGYVDAQRRNEIAGFLLVVLGLAFMGLLPWPHRLVAPGLLEGARRSGSSALLGAAFAVCAAPCIGVVLASVLVLASDSSTVVRGSVLLLAYSVGIASAFVLIGVAFAPRDGRVSLAARPLQRDPVRERRHARRARPAPVLPPRLVAARAAEPAAGTGRARRDLARPLLHSPRGDDPAGGVDLFFRGKLEVLLPEHRLVTTDAIDEPQLVIADVSRIEPEEVADAYPDIPLVGFTNHTDTAGLRRAHAAGFDQVLAKSALDERTPDLIGQLLSPVE